MKKTQEKIEKNRVFIVIVAMVFVVLLITNSAKILKEPIDLFVVEDGTLAYEEPTEGYIIRDESVLQGENYKIGMVKVISDGERSAKSQVIFRYYSSSEDAIMQQINELDEEINEIIENSGLTLVSSDISSIDSQIEATIDSMHNVNYLQEIYEHKNKIEAYISKKAEITGTLSPEDSYLKSLTTQRNNLENELEKESEIITAPTPGTVSYRVDGLEEVLKTGNFDYLTTELLNSFELKVGASTPLSTEKGKIVNNFEAYIAVPINTENAMNAKIGDLETLRLSTADEIEAELIAIKEEENNRILVF